MVWRAPVAPHLFKASTAGAGDMYPTTGAGAAYAAGAGETQLAACAGEILKTTGGGAAHTDGAGTAWVAGGAKKMYSTTGAGAAYAAGAGAVGHSWRVHGWDVPNMMCGICSRPGAPHACVSIASCLKWHVQRLERSASGKKLTGTLRFDHGHRSADISRTTRDNHVHMFSVPVV